MDYIEVFGNLKANEKYGRKTPHKAILLLTVIEMYESNMISSNEIRYNQMLEDTFLKVWNRTLPNEATYYTSAFLPFWTMQNEGFWHLVPKRGKEDILSYLRESQMHPSENKIKDYIDYAELDEDLYFLMTLPAGRSSLKRVLLENNSNLSDKAIDSLAESRDNREDKSIEALDEYRKILNSDNTASVVLNHEKVDDKIQQNFYRLDEDVQIQLNIEYYKFLKEHKSERELFKELCPTVFDLYDKVSLHPVKSDEITPSLKFIYENFLMDLKINLLGVDGGFDIIDEIDHAIALLKGAKEQVVTVTAENEYGLSVENRELPKEKTSLETDATIVSEQESRRKDLPWTENEEELLLLCFDKGKSIKDIASLLGRPQQTILLRLANLGKIEYEAESLANLHNSNEVEQPPLLDYYVENMERQCFILNRNGERVYTTDGKFKAFHGKLYRFNYKDGICFTVKDMVRTDGVWDKGSNQIVSYSQADLFPLLDRCHYLDQIEDLKEGASMELNKIRVDGKWYDFDGNLIGVATEPLLDVMDEMDAIDDMQNGTFVPKGKLGTISNVLHDSYDYLWLMAIVNLCGDDSHSMTFSFDELACRMIAEAWELLYEYPNLEKDNGSLVECIDYLMEESKENMDGDLSWSTSKELVFAEIKDYPIGGVFEDMVDELVEKAPLNVLRIWIAATGERDLVLHSANFVNKCLYSLHLKKFDSYIEINPAWRNYLDKERLNIVNYIRNCYLDFLKS